MFETTTSNTVRRKLLTTVRTKLVRRATLAPYTFTADDVHVLLNERRFRGNRQSVIASLLNQSQFHNTGLQRTSDRPVAKHRRISEWTIYDDE